MRYFHAINPHLRIKFSFSFVIYMFTWHLAEEDDT